MTNNVMIPINQVSTVKKIAYCIYFLFMAAVILPILPVIGIVLAYVFENDATDIFKSHYQYLIRSFWIGILYFSIAVGFLFLAIGLLLVPLCIIWWVIRMAKGLKSLLREEAIRHPKTWLF